ncbi:hypothetical protein BU17DRAFT_94963 [Hysterangium stoloniferum]|nr:hypothetical protein BU17DRAFT_94963 [Hysterangium stoloniferum]
MAIKQTSDTYPSLAWVIVPIVLVPLGLYIRSRLAARKLARTGIGRGAPGFQTSVRKLAVTPEIAARLRAGEQVSPEEIAAATAAAGAKVTEERRSVEPVVVADDEENEWLPEGIRQAKTGGTKSRKSKKRR